MRRLRAVRLRYLEKGPGLCAGLVAELERGRWHAEREVGIRQLGNRLCGLQCFRRRKAGRWEAIVTCGASGYVPRSELGIGGV